MIIGCCSDADRCCPNPMLCPRCPPPSGRLKRKNHVVVLEGQVDVLQAKLAAAEGLIAKLQGQVKRLGGR